MQLQSHRGSTEPMVLDGLTHLSRIYRRLLTRATGSPLPGPSSRMAPFSYEAMLSFQEGKPQCTVLSNLLSVMPCDDVPLPDKSHGQVQSQVRGKGTRTCIPQSGIDRGCLYNNLPYPVCLQIKFLEGRKSYLED